MRDPAFFTTSILRKPERLLLRGGSFRKQLPLRVRVGYFHHPKLGHTLVDTGYSTHVTEPGKTRDVLLSAYRKLLGPNVLYPDPLEVGLNLLGLRKSQIDTVVLTHFHADHVSGLLDLPGTQVICARSGWTKMQVQSRIKNATEGVFASLLPADIEQRLTFFEDFPRVSAPLNLGLGWDIAGDGNVLGIDLPGHLEGHIGLCFTAGTTPFLYAVDVQWLVQAALEDRCPGLPASLVHHDAKAMAKSVAQVREFAAAGGDMMLCHDPHLHPFDIDRDI